MLTVLLGFLAKVLGELANQWFAQQNLIQSGVVKQQLAEQVQTNAQILKVDKALAAVVPLTAVSLSAIKPGSDPNFRD
jgi:hypothetical protein